MQQLTFLTHPVYVHSVEDSTLMSTLDQLRFSFVLLRLPNRPILKTPSGSISFNSWPRLIRVCGQESRAVKCTRAPWPVKRHLSITACVAVQCATFLACVFNLQQFTTPWVSAKFHYTDRTRPDKSAPATRSPTKSSRARL